MSIRHITSRARARAQHVDSLKSRLTRGGLAGLILKTGEITLTFGVLLLLARKLGPAGYGVYTYVLTIVTFLSIPAQFGLPALVVRETAKAEARADWSTMRGLWRWADSIGGLVALLLISAGALAAFALQEQIPPAHMSTFLWGLVTVPLLVLGNLRTASLRGLRLVACGQFVDSLVRPATFLALLLMIILGVSAPMTPAFAMACNAVACFMALLCASALLNRLSPSGLRVDTAEVSDPNRWLKSTLPLGVIASMGLINQQVDILMLGWFVSLDEVGVYRVAVQGANLVSLGLVVANAVAMPFYARLYETRDMRRFQRLATMSARVMLALAVLPAICFFAYGKFFLSFVFGPEFQVAYVPLVVLAGGHLIHAGFGTVGPLLNMAGFEKITMRIIIVAASSNVLMNTMLIPVWGINGAAIGTTLTLLLWNFLLWRAAREKLGVDSTAIGVFSKVS